MVAVAVEFGVDAGKAGWRIEKMLKQVFQQGTGILPKGTKLQGAAVQPTWAACHTHNNLRGAGQSTAQAGPTPADTSPLSP